MRHLLISLYYPCRSTHTAECSKFRHHALERLKKDIQGHRKSLSEVEGNTTGLEKCFEGTDRSHISVNWMSNLTRLLKAQSPCAAESLMYKVSLCVCLKLRDLQSTSQEEEH